jgi:hypothetical protein
MCVCVCVFCVERETHTPKGNMRIHVGTLSVFVFVTGKPWFYYDVTGNEVISISIHCDAVYLLGIDRCVDRGG